MNETSFTKNEIQQFIKREERRISRLKNKITDLKFDIETTKKSIAMWKDELKRVKS